jgi:integrase
MKGNIYAKHPKCACGGRFSHAGRKMRCVSCGRVYAGVLVVKFGRGVRRLFGDYQHAERFLNAMRFDSDSGQFDPRGYQRVSPLAIGTLADQYLAEKSGRKTHKDIERFLHQLVEFLGEKADIRKIGKAEVKRFLLSRKVGDKTRANYRAALSAFFKWAVEEGTLEQAPALPVIEYELGWRAITDWETQARIVDKVRELAPFRAWLGIDLLRTYPSLRPGDLSRIQEKDIGQEIILWNPTKLRNKRKVVRLLPEHAALVAEQKRTHPAMPSVCFFRHVAGRQSVKAGAPFGEKYLYKWWKRACAAIGVEGLDLYGGTRHTTVSGLAVAAGSEAARDASMHETNKAFDRYCQTQDLRALEMAKLVRCHQGATVLQHPNAATAGNRSGNLVEAAGVEPGGTLDITRES